MDYAPIPKDFMSLETGDVFKNCSLCSRPLLLGDIPYIIEKAYRKKETIFEYAMCLECYEKFHDSLSLKSRKLIENYFEEYVDLDQRYDSLIANKGRKTRSWLAHCLIKGTPRWQCEEYQICGLFDGEDIVFNGLPYLISGAAVDDLIQLLSPETLGAMNEMSDRIFGIDQPQSFFIV